MRLHGSEHRAFSQLGFSKIASGQISGVPCQLVENDGHRRPAVAREYARDHVHEGLLHHRVFELREDLLSAREVLFQNAGGEVRLSSLKQTIRWKEHQAKGGENGSRIQVPFDVQLTPTELKVVQFVARGLANREIAEELNVSQRTVESHVSNMLGKTNLHNRTELARWAIENQMA